MKKKRIFEFSTDAGLDEARREAVEQAIEQAAVTYQTDLEYGWQENDDSRLHIFVKRVEIEVRFHEGRAEVLAAAPLWAKAALTEQRKAQVQALIEEALRDAGLISARATA